MIEKSEEIKNYVDKLARILYDIPGIKRDIKIGKLMTEMEREFHIPMLNDEKYNSSNRDIINIFRAISGLRGSQLRMMNNEDCIIEIKDTNFSIVGRVGGNYIIVSNN